MLTLRLLPVRCGRGLRFLHTGVGGSSCGNANGMGVHGLLDGVDEPLVLELPDELLLLLPLLLDVDEGLEEPLELLELLELLGESLDESTV